MIATASNGTSPALILSTKNWKTEDVNYEIGTNKARVAGQASAASTALSTRT
jgi:hypothetical protein